MLCLFGCDRERWCRTVVFENIFADVQHKCKFGRYRRCVLDPAGRRDRWVEKPVVFLCGRTSQTLRYPSELRLPDFSQFEACYVEVWIPWPLHCSLDQSAAQKSRSPLKHCPPSGRHACRQERGGTGSIAWEGARSAFCSMGSATNLALESPGM